MKDRNRSYIDWRNVPANSRKEVELISIFPGLEIIIENFKPQEAFVTNFEVEPSSLELYFCLSGKIRRIIQGMEKEFILDPGQIAIWLNRSSRMITIEYLAGQPVLCVSVSVKPGLLDALFKGRPEWIPVDLRGVTMEEKGNSYYRTGEMSASMRIIAHQALNCNRQGFSRQLYLNSKALELLSCAISDLRSEKLSLHPSEQRMVHQAREILIHDPENPPTLLELSGKAGLNEHKLEMGFRQIYGTTVFGYLRNYRMEQARQFLEKGEMSVTEVSYSVGYSSLSYFAKAFARHFGIKPGSYLFEMRRKGNSQLSQLENPFTVKKNPSTVSSH